MADSDVIRYEIAKLEMKPGDVLVLKLDRVPPYEEIARWKTMLKSVFGENKFIILGPGCELQVVSEADNG